MGALKKIASPWLRPQLISPTFNGLVPIDPQEKLRIWFRG